MPNTQLQVLIRRDIETGTIHKIISPDLQIDLMKLATDEERNTVLQEDIHESQSLCKLIQRIVDHSESGAIVSSAQDTWKVKDFNRALDEWIEVTVNDHPNYIVPIIFSLAYFSTLGIDEYLGFYTDQVNDVSRNIAFADVFTDISASLVPFVLSHVVQNTAAITNAFFRKKIPCEYNLQDDFALAPTTKWLSSTTLLTLGITTSYFGLLSFNAYVNTTSSLNNLMEQYEAAYEAGLVDTLSRDSFLTLAKTSFFMDLVFDLLVQVSGEVTVVNELINFISRFFTSKKAKPQPLDDREPDVHREAKKPSSYWPQFFCRRQTTISQEPLLGLPDEKSYLARFAQIS